MKHFFTFLLLGALAASALAQSAPPLVQSNFEGVIVPLYMSSGSTQRLHVVFRARVTGLTAGNSYRYYIQGSTFRDVNKPQSGAGNPLLIGDNGANFFYTTQPKLTQDSSGILTADAQGTYTGWFAFVNSGNERFAADSIIRPTITLNEGGTGGNVGSSAITKRYSLDQTIRCLKHGTAAGFPNGTGIYGTSRAQAKNIVGLFSDVAGSGRPLTVAFIESEGVTVPSTVSWYANSVNNVQGRWGNIIPNTAEGLRNITLYNQAGEPISSATSTTGTWGPTNTVSPNGGTTPLVILPNDAPLSNTNKVAVGNLIVYPNPAKASLGVTIKASQPSAFSIYSGEGKLVHNGTTSITSETLKLPAGLYMLVSGAEKKKLLVE